MNNKTYKVWLSSAEHMTEFTAIAKESFGWRKIFKPKKLPPQFPYMKLFFSKYPVVFFANGTLMLSDTYLEFNISPKNNSNKYRNLQPISFSIPYNELKVERYIHKDPFMKSYNITWIKIYYRKNDKMYHYLVSAEGKFSLAQINRINNKISEELSLKIHP